MDDLQLGEHTIPENELEEFFETHGGPGGQHANRSHTAVRLRLDIGASSLPDEVKTRLVDRLGEVVEVVSADSRSQFRNRALARRRLKERLEAALVEETPRRATKPTRESRRRRLEKKRARAATKRLRRPPEDDY
ncbi:MAG TPA: alternative ribosome rescue aminoacyl-tRNA hydrolase ArfB [Acidimicrobiia bacterium]|jgi:ribosome-associated protein|nr:alternative ribosome rescue aminoacyl-tRNA hydrolase ArfB [Acidimicrobiia bacterium]